MQKLYTDYEVQENLLEFLDYFSNTHHKLEILKHSPLSEQELFEIGYYNKMNNFDISEEPFIHSKMIPFVRLDCSDPKLEEKILNGYRCQRLDNADIYLSLHSFNNSWFRTEKELGHLHGLLFDYDYKDVCRIETNYYQQNFKTLSSFQNYIVREVKKLPVKPFYILNSGHGVQFLYLFNNMPYCELEDFKKIQATIKYSFDEKLKLRHDVNTDKLTQIFRIPGTNNCKSLNNNFERIRSDLLTGSSVSFEGIHRVPTKYLAFSGKEVDFEDLIDCFDVDNLIETDLVQSCKEMDKNYKSQFSPPKELKPKKTATTKKKTIILPSEKKKQPVKAEIIPIQKLETKKNNETITAVVNRPNSPVTMFISQSMRINHIIQVHRLEKLAEIRNYSMPGLNDLFLLIYFNSLLIAKNEVYAVNTTIEMAKKLTHSVDETIEKIINHTASRTGIYNYSWNRVVEDLQITSNELVLLDKKELKNAEKELDQKIVKLYLSGLSLRKIAKEISTNEKTYSEKKIRSTIKRLNVTKGMKFEDIDFDNNGKYENGNYEKNKINNNISVYNEKEKPFFEQIN